HYRRRWFRRIRIRQSDRSFRRALELDQRDAYARNGLGVAFLGLGRYGDAAAAFARAATQEPKDLDL
ncbi:MAG: tetratricopeptide repeat protein, partial [Acidobacteria bacterium]|nr:tetratricopeptide repeat protein [Acidobacteriota bacterium]